MKRRKIRVGSLFMVAMVAMSMSSFEASVVSASGTQITEETTELRANQSYYISDAKGLKRLSWLVNNGQVAQNTSRPGIDNYGNITQGGAHISV